MTIFFQNKKSYCFQFCFLLRVRVMVFNDTFNNISVISWPYFITQYCIEYNSHEQGSNSQCLLWSNNNIICMTGLNKHVRKILIILHKILASAIFVLSILLVFLLHTQSRYDITEILLKVALNQSSRNCQSCQTWPAKSGEILPRTDTRLVFCNRKLMRTDIFFTRTTKRICSFVNPG